MQRLIAFIENNLHLLLFIPLQFFCLYLIFSLNPYQKAYFSNSASAVTARVNGTSKQVYNYFDLENQNLDLQENFTLQFENSSNQKINYLGNEVVIKDSATDIMFSAIPAQVVYNTVHKADNIFVINKGKKHGVGKNMGVVSSSGVAGIVLASGPDFSTVMSVLSSQFKFTPQINDEEFYTSVNWTNDRPNLMSIEGINKLEKIKIGDEVTTGMSSLLFPPNIPIAENLPMCLC
jgi:rod shape-determining protein MreC